MAKDIAIDFIIAGKKLSLNKKAVEDALKQVKPDQVKKYSVHIGEMDYPIKQVVSVACDLPIAAFATPDAYRILKRLGFNVKSFRA